MNHNEQRRGLISRVCPRAAKALAGVIGIVLGLAFLAPRAAQAQTQTYTETILYSFQGSPDGATPNSGVIQDSAGNLYGTTSTGGASGYGTVFKVDVTGKETVLYSFTKTGGDGAEPIAGLILDASGNLFGTTLKGGAFDRGTVFELDAAGKETVLHSFTGKPDGKWPYAHLTQDAEGNLYGTTYSGGAYADGTVFKIGTTGAETVLYSFSWPGGKGPEAAVVLDAAGNLYGTTVVGGHYGQGVAYKLDTSGIETVLHNFGGRGHAGRPTGDLIWDAAGNLYGPSAGGKYGQGAVFKLEMNGAFVLYSLDDFGEGTGARGPQGVLVRDGAGNLYGTSSFGGKGLCNCGTVFKIDPSGSETVLHSFTGTGLGDGAYPYAGLSMDSAGNLYGTTQQGGTSNAGVVFRLTPQ